jgi:hypothetical protein
VVSSQPRGDRTRLALQPGSPSQETEVKCEDCESSCLCYAQLSVPLGGLQRRRRSRPSLSLSTLISALHVLWTSWSIAAASSLLAEFLAAGHTKGTSEEGQTGVQPPLPG